MKNEKERKKEGKKRENVGVGEKGGRRGEERKTMVKREKRLFLLVLDHGELVLHDLDELLEVLSLLVDNLKREKESEE